MPLFKLSQANYLHFIQIFNEIASNGKIRQGDVEAILKRKGVNLTSEESQKIIDSISVNSDGINIQAFLDYVSAWESYRDKEAEFAEAFRFFDRTGAGELSKDDVKHVMHKLGVRIDVDELMDECDENDDGFIQFEEFRDLMTRKWSMYGRDCHKKWKDPQVYI